MKKIISLILLLVILTACSKSDSQCEKEHVIEANGIVEKVETGSILVNNFREKSEEPNSYEDGKIHFQIEDKYYNEDGEKIKLTEIRNGDKVLIELSDDYTIQETSPGKIDSKYIKKIIKLNNGDLISN
ncbi:DUF3221 domain-containing protein [Listeria ivanovii]|uniref:lipoprotein n=1 Tax=Listeria ivanovii TaxID=1638 RepID=UPI000DA93863|nr:lipoprotein [Listeria ivanovii]PZF91326.1 DUF3221 domain-containing protein [Listeria ivanovii]PZF96834.1 DUF3221 domain-containing protein [Listeria ivanovii]PZG06919.1 DUF3221 domain-containing protein [Listeria ivanovii]PZG11840.1 DUF3221 domain-containing protein [Listeria ivanovii]PZG28965.1 DUF3221 domain-containing protein [Listeria ivanovii]